MLHFIFHFPFPTLQQCQARRCVWVHYQKESWCRIIYDFGLGFQKSYFKSPLWFGCIKTTQNNTGTFWEPEYVSGTPGLGTEASYWSQQKTWEKLRREHFPPFLCSLPHPTAMPPGQKPCHALAQTCPSWEGAPWGGAGNSWVGMCGGPRRQTRKHPGASGATSSDIRSLTLAGKPHSVVRRVSLARGSPGRRQLVQALTDCQAGVPGSLSQKKIQKATR